MLLPHVACGVELLLSSSGNLKNKPWSTRCCSVLFPRGFCGSTDRKRSFLAGRSHLSLWSSVAGYSTRGPLQSRVTCFSHVMGPPDFLVFLTRCSPREKTHVRVLGKQQAGVFWVKLQRNVGFSNLESSERGKRIDLTARGTHIVVGSSTL